MNWYIGQRIVAIKNHSQGAFKKGDEFTVQSLTDALCKCGKVEINIGMTSWMNAIRCSKCNIDTQLPDNTWWFKESQFAPFDVDISELTDILKEPIKDRVIEVTLNVRNYQYYNCSKK